MEEFDRDKVDDATLALLWLTVHGDKFGSRAWKSSDWDTMDRLHEKGFIGDPKVKAKSVVLTEEGVECEASFRADVQRFVEENLI